MTLAWSYSRLNDFVTCPKQFHTVHVMKSIPKEPPSEAQIWGEYVHKCFELYVCFDEPLPDELTEHKPYLSSLKQISSTYACEKRMALAQNLLPCDFFATDVWVRGILDFVAINDNVATIIDYKTGAVKPDIKQLALFALFVFQAYPNVVQCNTKYYWTKAKYETSQIYLRNEIPALWSKFVPDLKQYKEAFQTDIWQPRPSGLCYGWCPVKECEFWRPKK